MKYIQKGNNLDREEFPEVQIKRQIVDYYQSSLCNITSSYKKISVENQSPDQTYCTPYKKQTDEGERIFFKTFHRK